jgi:hypothetical protein
MSRMSAPSDSAIRTIVVAAPGDNLHTVVVPGSTRQRASIQPSVLGEVVTDLAEPEAKHPLYRGVGSASFEGVGVFRGGRRGDLDSRCHRRGEGG